MKPGLLEQQLLLLQFFLLEFTRKMFGVAYDESAAVRKDQLQEMKAILKEQNNSLQSSPAPAPSRQRRPLCGSSATTQRKTNMVNDTSQLRLPQSKKL